MSRDENGNGMWGAIISGWSHPHHPELVWNSGGSANLRQKRAKKKLYNGMPVLSGQSKHGAV